MAREPSRFLAAVREPPDFFAGVCEAPALPAVFPEPAAFLAGAVLLAAFAGAAFTAAFFATTFLAAFFLAALIAFLPAALSLFRFSVKWSRALHR